MFSWKVKVSFVSIFLLFVSLLGETLEISVPSTPQALGGAYSALANDVNGIWLNPAGISKSLSIEMMAFGQTLPLLPGLRLFCFGALIPFSVGCLGIDWVGLSGILKEGEKEQENYMEEQTLGITYGLEITKMVAFGSRIKKTIINSILGGGGGLGVDMGLLVTLGKHLSFALVGKNLLTSVKDEVRLPSFRLGLTLKLFNKIIFLADFDTKHDINGKIGVSFRPHTGVEFRVVPNFALRAGYDNGDLCGGLGITWKKFSLNYAYRASSVSGGSHKISLSTELKKYKPVAEVPEFKVPEEVEIIEEEK
jgi:hypothetical protein